MCCTRNADFLCLALEGRICIDGLLDRFSELDGSHGSRSDAGRLWENKHFGRYELMMFLSNYKSTVNDQDWRAKLLEWKTAPEFSIKFLGGIESRALSEHDSQRGGCF